MGGGGRGEGDRERERKRERVRERERECWEEIINFMRKKQIKREKHQDKIKFKTTEQTSRFHARMLLTLLTKTVAAKKMESK